MNIQQASELFGADPAERTLKLSIYVPSKDSNGNPVDSAAFRIKAAAILSRIAGGATEVKASGMWIGDCARVVSEPVAIVYTYLTEDDLTEHASELKGFLHTMGKELQQACVGFSINSQFFLIHCRNFEG